MKIININARLNFTTPRFALKSHKGIRTELLYTFSYSWLGFDIVQKIVKRKDYLA